VVDEAMSEELDSADKHATTLAGSGSFGAGCEPNTEADAGWSGDGEPTREDVDPTLDDEGDPFDREKGLYLGYQFPDEPGYWEQPIAFGPLSAARVTEWAGRFGVAVVATMFTWGSDDTPRQTVEATIPAGPGCTWHDGATAREMPRRVAAYRPRTAKIYKYDHVPMRIGARKFAGRDGRWFHYLCGPATPSGISGPAPGTRLSAVQADYYLTPHWVYAENLTAADLNRVAPILRAVRGQVDAPVLTSPENRAVVGLRTWMWAGASRYTLTGAGIRAEVVPTGIRVVAPGVPLEAHDLRRGGCRTGGVPDTGGPDSDTDCWLRFTKANSADPADVHTVGFALRWEVRVAGVATPFIVWTTRTQAFRVGEVQVANR
jgi:hypothetical protein